MYSLAVTKKSNLLASIFSISLILSNHIAAQTLEQIQVLSVDYPPFTTKNSDDYGKSFRQLEPIINALGFSAIPLFFPPARANKQLLDEKAWCFSFIEPRKRQLSYRPIIFEHTVIPFYLYRKKTLLGKPFQWQDYKDISGQRVGVLRYIENSLLYAEMKNSGLIMYPVETLGAAFNMLNNDRIDLVLSDPFSAQYYFSSLDIPAETMEHSENIIFDKKHTLWFNLQCKQAQKLYNAMR